MGRTFSWTANILIGLMLLFLGSADVAVAAEKIKITLPGVSTTFAPLYHAQSAGYFAEEGLEVEVVVVLGAGSVQAVLSRDAQFAIAPGPYQLLAHEKGQPLMAVMSILTRNAINIVMHKDAAKQKGIADRSPLADKIKALRGPEDPAWHPPRRPDHRARGLPHAGIPAQGRHAEGADSV